MVTTRHAAAEQAAAVEQAAPRRGRTVRREEEQEQEQEERAWQEARRAEMRRRQREIATKREELQERRTERAERKREREALWVDHCNRQNEHIAALHESWEAPPPKPLPPPVGDPPLNKRRKTQHWTAEEVEALEEYVAQYGDSNWAFMLKQDKEGDKVFHREEANEDGELEWVPTRNNVQLKDKWRSLKAQAERTPARRRRAGQQAQHPQLPWSEAEEHGLVRLVAQHGTSNWQLIKDSPEGQAVFHDIRTNVHLKTKWDLLARKPEVMAQLRAHRQALQRRAQQAEAQAEAQQQQQQQQAQQQQQQPQTQQRPGRLGTAAVAAGGAASHSRELGRPTPARRQKVQQLHLVEPHRLDFDHM